MYFNIIRPKAVADLIIHKKQGTYSDKYPLSAVIMTLVNRAAEGCRERETAEINGSLITKMPFSFMA